MIEEFAFSENIKIAKHSLRLLSWQFTNHRSIPHVFRKTTSAKISLLPFRKCYQVNCFS